MAENDIKLITPPRNGSKKTSTDAKEKGKTFKRYTRYLRRLYSHKKLWAERPAWTWYCCCICLHITANNNQHLPGQQLPKMPGVVASVWTYLFIYFIFHNKDYTSITLYKDVARGPQETTRLVRGGPLVTIISSNRNISTHNNKGYRTHYWYNKKSKTFVLNNPNKKTKVIEFGKEFQIFGPWNKIVNCLVLVWQAWEQKCEEVLALQYYYEYGNE